MYKAGAAEWQAEMQALLLVAEHDGPMMFARIGVTRALNRRVERVFNTDHKDQHKLSRRPSILTASAQTEADHFAHKLEDGRPHRGLGARRDHVCLKDQPLF